MPGARPEATPADDGFRLAGPPAQDVEVPAALARFAVGAPLEPVWRNQTGGLTWRSLGPDGAARLYLKWSPTGGPDLAHEARRLAWLAGRVPVPEVVLHGSDASGGWLVTRAIAAHSAVSPRWRDDPRTAARAIGTGLRRLHDQVPVGDCPFTWSVAERLEAVHERLAEGHGPDRWHPDHQGLDVDTALRLLADVPAPDPVVCHGDACAPNTLIDDEGRWAGLVDLGRLGVGDRWADLAVATWSLDWNYGPGWERTLLDAYGIEPDARRSAYYRLLWDLS